jgi:hypothetical protein
MVETGMEPRNADSAMSEHTIAEEVRALMIERRPDWPTLDLASN